MTSERIQRRIERLLDQIESAADARDWTQVKLLADDILRVDPENLDAKTFLTAAERDTGVTSEPDSQTQGSTRVSISSASQPTSFASGRYAVKRFLGEGGKKKVYLAHDSLLDRDVAFALIKTEGLDEESRTRITREAQAMGRLGDHPNIVTVYDIGSEGEQPYLVLPVLAGGDVEGVIEKAPEQRMPLEQALKIAIETCRGLEFAHGKGIVHRDLKPGNVWLSEDGTAKIGDFGLAVAMDKSRLTQAGMMVGTVSYMPPEQAMGGEVGPRSDLYSLGAMLYEMVCGRPPFVGDESVAIIGQHLNTSPVTPSWHRPDCPRALEALILRLLEKDPGRRPASATEVRTALEGVSVGTASPRDPTVTTEAPAGNDNPLYRRTFVGRENEVRQLQQAFDGAMSGNGALVMVVGEPGIGKTAICEQLATYVALRGGKALVGHCYEEGSLSLPYLAFVEAMRSYVLAREPDGLRSDLGTGAADVARIVSEVRDRVQGVELRPPGDPEDDRWRLLQSVTSFLRNASTVQPLVIVLEDLHWADRGTLDLLLHVARNLQGTRLLIIGNYRDVEVDRTHPLSGVLADLRRINSFASVRLRGLTVDEVHRMYETVRGNTIPWSQAEAVFRQTEGNPLFVQEVLRYLVEEGIVVREGGRYVAQQGEGVGIPEGLRDVVGKRLNRLGEKTNQVLSIAAVIGRDFRLDVLQAVANLPDEEVIQALEEATERAVVEQHQGFGGQLSFRFTHAFFRQTLYEELFAARRIRMHQQVARALEEAYGRRVEEHAAELAEHYANSSDPSDLAKSVHYSEVAAQRSLAVYAYSEAVRHLDQALKAQEVMDPDDKARRCAILLGLGDALLAAGDPNRLLDTVAPAALALAEELGDKDGASRACQLALGAIFASQAAPGWLTPAAARWAEKANEFAEEGTVHRVLADASLGRVYVVQGQREKGRDLVARSLTLARTLNNNPAFWFAAVMRIQVGSGRGVVDLDERLEIDRELLYTSRQGVGLDVLRSFFVAARNDFLLVGGLDEVEVVFSELRALAQRTKQPNLELAAMFAGGLPLTMAGRLEEAVTLGESILAHGEVTALKGYAGASAWIASYCALLYLGIVEHPIARWQPLWETILRLSRSEDEVSKRELAEAYHRVGGEVAVFRWEPALKVGDVEVLRELRTSFEGSPAVLTSGFMPMSVSRLLAATCSYLGEVDAARSHYERALEICERLAHRPELALSQLGFAELLLEHYPDEHEAAIEHLDFAIAELRDMKMQPALERALRHRGLLKA